MAAGKLATTALVLGVLGMFMFVGVQSHGSLTVPRSRNVIAPIQGQTWWKDHGNGHGNPVVKPANGPGEFLLRLARMMLVDGEMRPNVHSRALSKLDMLMCLSPSSPTQSAVRTPG